MDFRMEARQCEKIKNLYRHIICYWNFTLILGGNSLGYIEY